MRNIFCLFITVVLSSMLSAQSNFKQLQKKLHITCGPIVVENNRHDIEIIEAYLKNRNNDYRAWHEIAKDYYLLAGQPDSTSNINRAIEAEQNFLKYCPEKQKYLGHWNLALWKAYIRNCNEAHVHLEEARKRTKKVKWWKWDNASEEWLLGLCAKQ